MAVVLTHLDRLLVCTCIGNVRTERLWRPKSNSERDLLCLYEKIFASDVVFCLQFEERRPN